MSILSEIQRITTAKIDLKNKLRDKSVQVDDALKLDAYPPLLDQIKSDNVIEGVNKIDNGGIEVIRNFDFIDLYEDQELYIYGEGIKRIHDINDSELLAIGYDDTDNLIVNIPNLSENTVVANTTILNIQGKFSSDGTITANKVLSGEIGYSNGNKIIGNIPIKKADNISISNNTITIPAGYYSTSISKSVAAGNVAMYDITKTTPVTISVSNAGVITATCSFSETYSPTLISGYIDNLSSSEIKISGSNTKNLTTLGARTYTPTTYDQTINKSIYLTGNQTIKGDANLVSSNIKVGTSIFGIDGELIPALQGVESSSNYLYITKECESTVIDILGNRTIELLHEFDDLSTTQISVQDTDGSVMPLLTINYDEDYIYHVTAQDLESENIRDGYTILNVTGTYKGGIQGVEYDAGDLYITEGMASINISANQQDISLLNTPNTPTEQTLYIKNNHDGVWDNLGNITWDADGWYCWDQVNLTTYDDCCNQQQINLKGNGPRVIYDYDNKNNPLLYLFKHNNKYRANLTEYVVSVTCDGSTMDISHPYVFARIQLDSYSKDLILDNSTFADAVQRTEFFLNGNPFWPTEMLESYSGIWIYGNQMLIVYDDYSINHYEFTDWFQDSMVISTWGQASDEVEFVINLI